ncbi:MAG: hypothetical protein A2096_04760 [Spirochaetes bacterium GWF1_41_5]|nr:MAG: hypothetical protein A2096_04760 [Spirochaetes bacterium GWF1_41_5]
MRKSVYIESTIPSYYVAEPSRDIVLLAHQGITREWWNTDRQNYDLYISEIIITEISKGDSTYSEKRKMLIADIDELEMADGIVELTKEYFEKLHIPQKAANDAFHIAFTVYHNIDYLLTWNCKHMANPITRERLHKINASKGLITPEICTPDELLNMSKEADYVE